MTDRTSAARAPLVLAPFMALCAALATSGLLAPAAARAQDREDAQAWSALLATAQTAPAPPNFALWLDVHGRRGGANTIVLLRPGVGFAITPWLSVWAGYAWIPTFDDATSTITHEHRIWQQAILSPRLEALGLAFQSRTRLEQRFSELGGDVALRVRQFVRANWQPSPDFPMGIAVWDELFVGLTQPDWGAPQGIDQNRLFVGPFLQMAPWARLEAGYAFVYLDRGDRDLYAHVLAVNLFVSPRPAPEAAAPEAAAPDAPPPEEPAQAPGDPELRSADEPTPEIAATGGA